MIKRLFYCFFMVLFIIPGVVFASDNLSRGVMIGNKYYDSLEDAILNVNSDETIMLMADYTVDDSLVINKTVNIDLNGHDISSDERVFVVDGGVLNISGDGTIREEEPNYGAIMVYGSDEISDSYYSVVNIGENVKLEGWSGVFVNHKSSKSYGVVVNLEGSINAVNDISGGTGAGVYVNGKIKDKVGVPVINILDGARIESTGNGLYIAGYSKVNIGKAYISGIESGIGIKAGILNIDGAEVVCNGEDLTPTSGYNNGIKPSGAAIQIESNIGYAGNIEVDIKDGNFKSKNSNVIYEYIGKGNTTLVKSMSIKGGNFIGGNNKDVILGSESFENNYNSFITGGRYSSNPVGFLSNGYTTVLDNDLYSVVRSTMGNAIKEISNNSYFPYILFVLIIGCGLLFLGYVNKDKIFHK